MQNVEGLSGENAKVGEVSTLRRMGLMVGRLPWEAAVTESEPIL